MFGRGRFFAMILCTGVGAVGLIAPPLQPAVARETGGVEAVMAFADGVRAFNHGRDDEARRAFEKAVELDPGHGDARYWLGLTYLRQGMAAEARDAIRASLQAEVPPEVDRPWVEHDLGQAQLAAGQAAAAAETLSAVVAMVAAELAADRDDGAGDTLEEVTGDLEAGRERRRQDEQLLARARCRYANALARLDRHPEAAAVRRQANELDPDLNCQQVPIVAPPWDRELPVAGKPRRRERWQGRVGLGAVSDSNPGLLSEELSFNVPDAGVISGSEADAASVLDLRLSAWPFSNRNGWSMGAALDGRQTSYQEFDFLDLGELRAAVHFARGKAPLGYLHGPLGPARVSAGADNRVFLLQAGIDYVQLDGRSYLTTLAAGASWIIRPAGARATQVDLQLLDRSFSEEPVAGRRSGEEARVQVSRTFYYGREDRFLRLALLGGKRWAGLPFEGALGRASAELSLPLAANRWSLYLLASFQHDQYAHPESDLLFREYDPFDPEFGELSDRPRDRQDTTLRATVALSWAPRANLQVSARFTAVDRDSNLRNLNQYAADLDYQRTIASMAVRWLF